MDEIKILFVIILVWLLGTISSYFHWKKVNGKLSELKQNFTGYLGTGISKVNFFRKVMVIIVADFDGKITDCQYLYGWTTFSNFRQKSELVGSGVDSVLEKANGDKFYDALKLSLNKIQEQRG